MSGTEVQVLVVVQEALLAGAISRALTDAGYVAHWAVTGQAARDMAQHQPYSAYVVGLMLPDSLGLHLIHSLRTGGHCGPAILIGGGALSGVSDGLNDPALVSLPKPFVMSDLVNRIRGFIAPPLEAISRPRTSAPPVPKQEGRTSYQFLEIDPEKRAVSCHGRSVSLTEREFAVLDCLMRRPEEVVTKAELSRAVWGSEDTTRSNVLEVYINFLRRKIDQGFDRKVLHTVRGAGYILRAES
jgi:two-component system OmpR family response regulator